MVVPALLRWSIFTICRSNLPRLGCVSMFSTHPPEIYFTQKHEWIKVNDKKTGGTVGITKYAEQKLGDIVYVDLPEKGSAVTAHEQCGVIESVKAVSDIFSPASGEVTEINPAIDGNTGLINKSPLDEGWLFKISLSKPEELKELMSEESYKKFLETEE
ncbi:unnamed protein product [Calicophoron daubneyi]|uniref:Glycine cleavage system H protein n=1 Tax=Calicophoron daubneyi TaxID=300641 RepID=A0AAV2TIB4_CALDB